MNLPRTTPGAPIATATKDLPDYGWVRFRKADKAEPHSWQPSTVRLLQTVVGTARGAARCSCGTRRRVGCILDAGG